MGSTISIGGKSGGESKDNSFLFGKKEEKKAPTIDPAEFLEHVNSIDRRLRTLESRYNDLNRKIQFMDKSFSSEKKRIFDEIKAGDEINMEQKKEIGDLKDTLRRVIAEFKNFSPIEDLNVLRKYVDLWEPVSFVTRSELDYAVKIKVKEAFRERRLRLKKAKEEQK